MSSRHALLALLLAGTMAAAFWPRDEADTLVEAVTRPARQAVPGTPPGASTEARPVNEAMPSAPSEAAGPASEMRFATADAVNLFPRQSFRPPPKPAKPAPVLPPPPPPPPMAPPVPFGYVGAWTENGQETVFLSRGEQVIGTHRGATLPGGWRLDTVSPEGLTFTYVSLNQQRTLRIGP